MSKAFISRRLFLSLGAFLFPASQKMESREAQPTPPVETTKGIQMTTSVASPLTLVMPIKSKDDYHHLKQLLENLQSKPPEQNPIEIALTRISTVHFARFVFLGETQLAVITTYDGSFEDYIDAFVNEIGEIFDSLLSRMGDAPPLPVSEHRQAFLDYVKSHDIPCVGNLYCAYPSLKVLDILTLAQDQASDNQ